jgi:hypothetical protein
MNAIPVVLIPSRNCGKLGAREFCQWVEIETVNVEAGYIEKKSCRYSRPVEPQRSKDRHAECSRRKYLGAAAWRHLRRGMEDVPVNTQTIGLYIKHGIGRIAYLNDLEVLYSRLASVEAGVGEHGSRQKAYHAWERVRRGDRSILVKPPIQRCTIVV